MARDALVELGGVLGLGFAGVAASGESDGGPFIDLLVSIRQELRGAKQYELADSVRDRLTELGVALEDTRDGTRWRRVQPEPEAVEEEPGADSLVESALRF